jgi:AcrR family transcriptional regulator
VFKARIKKALEAKNGEKQRKRVGSSERKEAILEAALCVFSERGFEAARMDEVAARAGIAKGTLYLHFADKEALFEELLRGVAEPVLEQIATLSELEGRPVTEVLRLFLKAAQTKIIDTKRVQILRLLVAEGHRFPRIAKFYHQHVVSRGRDTIVKLAKRGFENGELSSDALARFPQLFFAPVMMAAIWNGMFSEFDPLDVEGLFAEHARIMFGEDQKGSEP